MKPDRPSVLDFFKAIFGQILIVTGILFMGAGLLFITQMGSIAFAVGLFLGTLLMVLGFVVYLELFRINFRSWDGLGTILLCVAPMLTVAGFILLFFTAPDFENAYWMPVMPHGRVIPNQWILTVPLARIYVWLTIPLLIAGAAFFVVGFLLKVFDNVL